MMINLNVNTDNELVSWLNLREKFDNVELRDNWVDFILANCSDLAGRANITTVVEVMRILNSEGIEYFVQHPQAFDLIVAPRSFLVDKEKVCEAVSFFAEDGTKFYRTYSENYQKVMEIGSESEIKELNRRLNNLER